MRARISLLFLALIGCGSIIERKSDVEILEEYKAYHQRLDRIASTILQANADLCPRSRLDNGFGGTNWMSTRKICVRAAKTHFGFDGEAVVFFITPDSLALEKDIQVGDKRSEVLNLDAGTRICNYETLIRFEADANAYATGQAVIVTSGLMRSLSDLELSLVFAHELAHNVLGHAGEAVSQDNEREADRYAVYFLAKADLDYRAAITSYAATDQPYLGRTKPNHESRSRREHFKTIIDEIADLKADGAPILP